MKQQVTLLISPFSYHFYNVISDLISLSINRSRCYPQSIFILRNIQTIFVFVNNWVRPQLLYFVTSYSLYYDRFTSFKGASNSISFCDSVIISFCKLTRHHCKNVDSLTRYSLIYGDLYS